MRAHATFPVLDSEVIKMRRLRQGHGKEADPHAGLGLVGRRRRVSGLRPKSHIALHAILVIA